MGARGSGLNGVRLLLLQAVAAGCHPRAGGGVVALETKGTVSLGKVGYGVVGIWVVCQGDV